MMTNAMILANNRKQFKETMTAAEYNERLAVIRQQIVPYTEETREHHSQWKGRLLRAMHRRRAQIHPYERLLEKGIVD